jgi:hypothetical protein
VTDPASEQAEALADEWMALMRDRADMMITTLCDTEGMAQFTPQERELVDCGVEAGMAAAMVVLRERGLLAGGDGT